MSFMYILIAVVILWMLYRAFTKASRESPKDSSPGITLRVSTQPLGAQYSDEPDHSVARRLDDIDKDNWEGSFWDVEAPMPVKATLRMNYEDGNGKMSERTVDVRQFGAFGESTLIIGHCHMRNATRTFRADRIRKCVDEESGEVVSDVAAFLRAKYESSPEFSANKLLDEEYDTLRILLYVGKADGQLRAAEKDVIRDTCRALTNDSRITTEGIDDLMKNMDIPSIHAFKLAVGRLSGKPVEAKQALIKAAQDMVATQKTVHPAEQEALDYMAKRLTAAAT